MHMRAFWVNRPASVLTAALVLAACTSAPHQAKTAVPAIHAEVAFACLWWSEAQMESLNPNAPPPKTTDVKLTKWEYSDPVGVPHPDTVDVVVSVDSAGQNVSSLEAEVTGEWKNGPLRNAATAAWSQPVLLQKFEGVTVEASRPKILRVPVNLKAMMDSLGSRGEWPYGLRATVKVRVPAASELLAQAAGELPIKPGD